MKISKLCILGFSLAIILSSNLFGQNFYPYSAISFNKVNITDNFWLPKIEVNRKETIPWSFAQCKQAGRMKNFEQAAEGHGKYCGVYVFNDSDLYKVIEGAAYSLQIKYDKTLDMYVDSLIELIGKAQEKDGYLYTARTMHAEHKWLGTERYEKEHLHSHELYNVGHFYEAATAHFAATGKKSMLNIAIKNADHLLTVFGPGKKEVAPGHQVIEIGLTKLYLATNEKKYLDLAQFFIEARGKRKYDKALGTPNATVYETGEYWQDHKPAIEQTEATGHAVRAGYLYSGMADVAALTQNQKYIDAIHKIWKNAAERKTYITGGIGAAGDWEGFGPDYDLPNESAYCETCAAIANVYWNHRMFMLTGESKYVDMVERTLFNGIIGGIGLDGKSFYYANPMEYSYSNGILSGENKRSPWFECSCCPTNISRFMPSIGGYIYAQKDNDLYVNLYMQSNTSFTLTNGQEVKLNQKSNYPWDGKVTISLESKNDIDLQLNLRVPDFTTNKIFPTDLYFSNSKNSRSIALSLNGKPIKVEISKSGYIVIKRKWSNKDVLTIDLPMDVKIVESNELLKSNKNLMAVQRGPILYCAEFPDNNNKTSNLYLSKATTFNEKYEEKLLNGVMTLSGTAKAVVIENDDVKTIKKDIKLIPYYARSNRGIGEMKLWFPTKISNVKLENR